jgi:hypothetical protein
VAGSAAWSTEAAEAAEAEEAAAERAAEAAVKRAKATRAKVIGMMTPPQAEARAHDGAIPPSPSRTNDYEAERLCETS